MLLIFLPITTTASRVKVIKQLKIIQIIFDLISEICMKYLESSEKTVKINKVYHLDTPTAENLKTPTSRAPLKYFNVKNSYFHNSKLLTKNHRQRNILVFMLISEIMFNSNLYT